MPSFMLPVEVEQAITWPMHV